VLTPHPRRKNKHRNAQTVPSPVPRKTNVKNSLLPSPKSKWGSKGSTKLTVYDA
jgi:hypothetical protein